MIFVQFWGLLIPIDALVGQDLKHSSFTLSIHKAFHCVTRHSPRDKYIW